MCEMRMMRRDDDTITIDHMMMRHDDHDGIRIYHDDHDEVIQNHKKFAKICNQNMSPLTDKPAIVVGELIY